MKRLVFLYLIIYSVTEVCVASNDVMPDTIMLDEITISAIKQGIADNESSTSIIDQQTSENNRVVTIKDASNLIPNFYIPDYGSRITSSIYVRGIGARMDQPAVGLNVDNVPVMSKDAYDFDLVDIAKVEMIRGPQSTLYGRNTMGGLVNLTTLSPMRWQGVRLMAEYGLANCWKGAVSWYHKFGNNIGFSLSAYYTSSDGFFDNEYNGEKCDWEHQLSGRAKLEWRISDRLMLQNVFSVSDSRQGGYPYEYIKTKTISYNDTCFYKRFTFNDGLTLKWSHDKFYLSSITSIQYLDDNMTLDQDFLPLEYFTLTQTKKELALTEDIVAKSNNNQAYNWLIGLFGFHKNLDMSAPVTFKDYGISQLIEKNRNDANPHYPIEWENRNFRLNSDFINRTTGVALYHQSSLDLDRWHIKLGLRFDYEYSTLNYRNYCNTGYNIYKYDAATKQKDFYKYVPVDIELIGKLSNSFTELLPKLSVSYDLNVETLANIYLSCSKGYKAGGFNTQMFSDFLQQKLMGMMGVGASYDVNDIVKYNPEESWNYELGAHFTAADNILSVDMSLFYIDCINQQMTVFPDGTTTGRIMTNAGKTRSYGAEFVVNYTPITNLRFNFNYGYTNAKFVDYDNGKTNYAGMYLPYVPQHTMYTGATYDLEFKTSWLKNVIFDINVRGVGKIYWEEANVNVQDFYALLGASVTFDFDIFSLQCWGRNITNTDYSTFYFVSIKNEFLQRGKPATCGVTLRVNI